VTRLDETGLVTELDLDACDDETRDKLVAAYLKGGKLTLKTRASS